MADYSEWLLKLEERMPMLYQTIKYCYRTKMAIPWTIVFFGLAGVAWYEIANLYMAYIVFGFSMLVGVIITVLMIKSMNVEVKEVVWLRELYHKFINSLQNDPGNMWNPRTIKSFDEFQKLFKRICPEASINVPICPDEEQETETKLKEIKPIKPLFVPSFKTTKVESTYKEDAAYKSKLEMEFQSEQECFIKAAIWKADGGVALQLPERLKLRPKNINGEWSQDEFSTIAVPSGGMFRVWIGLSGKMPQEVARQIHERKGFGTLLLKITGYDDEVGIPV